MYPNFSKDTSTAARTASDAIGNAEQGIMNSLSRTGAKVSATLSDGWQATRDKVSQATDATTRQVRNNPVQSAFIALGIGFILGNLSKR